MDPFLGAPLPFERVGGDQPSETVGGNRVMQVGSCTRPANGRTEWKDAQGVTLKEHQERSAAAASLETEA